MKYFINFKPTVVYRKGSSFLLKTSIFILYFIPIVILIFFGMRYFALKQCVTITELAKKGLVRKSNGFYKRISRAKLDVNAVKSSEKRLFAYERLHRAYSISWSGLLAELEKVTPKSVKFSRVKIRPAKLVKVVIAGKAKNVSEMTNFLRALFASKSFVKPYLKHQTLSSAGKSDEVAFDLEVGYSPLGGTLL